MFHRGVAVFAEDDTLHRLLNCFQIPFSSLADMKLFLLRVYMMKIQSTWMLIESTSFASERHLHVINKLAAFAGGFSASRTTYISIVVSVPAATLCISRGHFRQSGPVR